jgi:hypothetical protein
MLEERVKATLKDAAPKLTGPKKRAFMANVAADYFESSARKTETYLGWGRAAVQLGLHERRVGVICQDNYAARGDHTTEEKQPIRCQLEADIRQLVEGQSQADPQLRTTFYYARVSAQAVRDALIEEKGYADESLPTRQTIGAMLNRMGYRLKKHKK